MKLPKDIIKNKKNRIEKKMSEMLYEIKLRRMNSIRKSFILDSKSHNLFFKDWIELNVCNKSEHEDYVLFLNSLSLNELKSFVMKDPSFLSFVNDLPEDFIISLINKESYRGEHFKYIKDQTVNICISALKINPELFLYVRIVPNSSYEATLKNLLDKKSILEVLR